MFSLLIRIHDGITRAGFYVGGGALCGIVLSFWVEVIARYFFNSPTLWSGSLVAYFLCIAMSLATPELARVHGHVAITVLTDRMSPRLRSHFQVVVNLLSGAVCLLAAWIFLGENVRQFNSGTTTALGLDIPKYWISLFISYGFFNTALYFIRHALCQMVSRTAVHAQSQEA